MKKHIIILALACAMTLILCGSVSAADAPSANFTANTTNGIGPLSVHFTDTSTGTPTSWNWNFGDGGTSTEQNPTHTYTDVGAHNVTLSVSNDAGSSSLIRTNYVTAWNTSSAIPKNNGIDIYVANDAGVKYDMPNGVTTPAQYGGVYPYTPNTYYIAQGGGGTNPIQLSTDPNNKVGQITTTNNQSGTFYVVFSGGIGHLDDAILLLAVNGTLPANFSVTITSSGYTYTLPAPATTNPTTSSLTNITYVTNALNETFTASDFIYGTQAWKPANTVNYPIFNGEDVNSPNSQFHLMFIDLNVGGFVTGAIADEINSGSITVTYSFNNLPASSFAAFGAYGWFSACNWGTGSPQYSNIYQSGFNVQGIPAVQTPVANFTANATSGSNPLNVQFTDESSNGPTSWLWNFGDGATSTSQNPTHTYTTSGTYTVSLTAGNSAGNNTITQTNFITVLGPVVDNRTGLTYTSIQDAINDSNTTNGDTITVNAGNYIENVILNKSLILTALGLVNITPLDSSLPVFAVTGDGSGSVIQGFTISGALNSSGISVFGNNVTIVNDTITGNNMGVLVSGNQDNITGNNITGNSWAGIVVDTSTNDTISNNTVFGNQEGIYLTNSSNNAITGNQINNNTVNGLNIQNSSQNTITNNTITGNGVSTGGNGLILKNGTQNTLENNTVQNNGWSGIVLDGSSSNIIGDSNGGNTITGNDNGLVLYNGSNMNTIYGNTISNNSYNGLELYMNCENNQITNNTINGNQVTGLLVQESNSNNVTGNTVENNAYNGVLIAGSSQNTVNSNNIDNNGAIGLLLTQSSNNTISGNQLTGNVWTNIVLDNSTLNQITGNTVNGNNTSQQGIALVNSSNNNTINNNTVTNNTANGVNIQNSDNNQISGNSITQNGVIGLLISNGNSNTVSGNTFQNSGWAGTCIVNSTNNSIIQNNYINNPGQAYDNGTNSYDNGTTGNYYSDWSSTDPRSIDGGSSVDNHPSTTPF